MNTVEDMAGVNEQDENNVNIREMLFPYLTQWKWFVVSIILFTIIGYAVIRLSTPQYKIQTNLLIKDNKGTLNGQNDLLKELDMFSSDKIIDNEVQILQSITLLDRVVKALNLQTTYYATQRVRMHEVYDVPFKVQLIKPSASVDYNVAYTIQLLSRNEMLVNGKKYPTNKIINTPSGLVLVTVNTNTSDNVKDVFEVKFSDVEDVISFYKSEIKVNAVSKQGTVLEITLEDAIPQKGKDILNRLVFEYNRAAIEDKNKSISSTLSFITDRLVKLQEELGNAERKVENYKSGNQITDISSQSQIFLQNVQNNDAQLSKINIQIGILKNIEGYLDQSKNATQQVPSMLGIEDPTLLALVTQLGEIQLKKQSLLQTVPETNPIVSAINDQIASLKTSINQSLKNLKTGLDITKRQLESKNASFQSVITNVPSKERGLLDVMRQQEIKNNLFTYLLQKREETEISLASSSSDSRIIDEANSSRTPVKPVKALIFVVFLLLGGLVPVGIIYLKNMLNFKVSKKSDIENTTHVPIIAEISHSNDSSPLLVVAKPRSMIAEQLRALRTNLNFIIPNKSQKVLLFTSSISGEGKSFISLNLGASLAMSGKKVVILELDLRKPKLHAGLEIPNESGLSNYLIGESSITGIVKPISQQEGYYIITSGPIPPNPAELLVNGKIGGLIEDLKKDFDYVLLDAPPVGLVTDAQILAAYADTTLFIVRHNYTAKAHVKSLEQFRSTKKFANLNLVLNSIDTSGGYGYSYGYGYGYGGYYQQDEPEKKSFFERMFK